MPTILFINGWRFYFYSNENNEPMHIHCSKAEKRCKFWIMPDNFNIAEAYILNMSVVDIRFVRKTIFANFDFFVEKWNDFFGGY